MHQHVQQRVGVRRHDGDVRAQQVQQRPHALVQHGRALPRGRRDGGVLHDAAQLLDEEVGDQRDEPREQLRVGRRALEHQQQQARDGRVRGGHLARERQVAEQQPVQQHRGDLYA